MAALSDRLSAIIAAVYKSDPLIPPQQLHPFVHIWSLLVSKIQGGESQNAELKVSFKLGYLSLMRSAENKTCDAN